MQSDVQSINEALAELKETQAGLRSLANLAQLQDMIEDADERLDKLHKEEDGLKVQIASLAAEVVSAQGQGAAIISEAQAEADRLIAEAQATAAQLVADGQARANRLVKAASDSAAKVDAVLAGARSKLTVAVGG